MCEPLLHLSMDEDLEIRLGREVLTIDIHVSQNGYRWEIRLPPYVGFSHMISADA